MAEKLGIPQITYLEELVGLEDGLVRVRRNVGNGWEVVESRLPVLITVLGSANQPRPPAAKRVMRFKRARVEAEVGADVQRELPQATEEERAVEIARRVDALRQSRLLIEQWSLDDIHADLSRCGLAGSPTKVFRVQAIVLTKQGYSEVAPTEEGVRQLIHELVVDRTLG